MAVFSGPGCQAEASPVFLGSTESLGLQLWKQNRAKSVRCCRERGRGRGGLGRKPPPSQWFLQMVHGTKQPVETLGITQLDLQEPKMGQLRPNEVRTCKGHPGSWWEGWVKTGGCFLTPRGLCPRYHKACPHTKHLLHRPGFGALLSHLPVCTGI